MTHYPILFTFADKISGNGFLARVTAHGQALVVHEPDGWWIYGVMPGGIAAGGATFPEAHAEFRKAFTTILFDIAEEPRDLREFRTEVGRFFREVNKPTEEEWQAAVLEVRAGRVTAAGISENLQKKPADSPRSVEVHLLRVPKPEDNILEPQLAVAA
jgi:preprotein translocase subunit Sss1